MNAFSSEKRYTSSMAFSHQADWHTNLLLFQGARADRVRVKSSSSCFSRELVGFVRPRELVDSDPHVTRSPQIGKRIPLKLFLEKVPSLSEDNVTTRIECFFFSVEYETTLKTAWVVHF